MNDDDLFNQILHSSALGDLLVPISNRKMSGGRALARRRYPNRDGQSTEDMGREPYVFHLTIPLYASVDANYYPSLYEQLRSALDDPERKGDLEYFDVELGPLDVKVIDWAWELDARQRDGGVFTITIEETSFAEFLYADELARSLTSSRDLARLMDDMMDELGLDPSTVLGAWDEAGVGMDIDYDAGTLLFTMVDDTLSQIEELARADELADLVDQTRTRFDAILALPDLVDASMWTMRTACVQTKDAVSQAVSFGPLIVRWTLSRPMSAWDICLELYGNTDRVGEVIENNPTDNPLFYPAHYVILVVAEPGTQMIPVPPSMVVSDAA